MITTTLLALALTAETAPPPPVPPSPQTVYQDDFEKDLRPGLWSHDKQKPEIFKSSGGHQRLGMISPGVLRLKLKDLPPHQALRIRFDFYINTSWDGVNGGSHQPKIFAFKITDGPNLLRSTISNQTYFVDKYWQSYPENFQEEHKARIDRLAPGTKFHLMEAPMQDILHPGGTGCLDRGGDAKYHFDGLCRHSSQDLDFIIELQNGWLSIDDIRIETLAEIPAIDVAIEWIRLIGDDPMAAQQAKYRGSSSIPRPQMCSALRPSLSTSPRSAARSMTKSANRAKPASLLVNSG